MNENNAQLYEIKKLIENNIHTCKQQGTLEIHGYKLENIVDKIDSLEESFKEYLTNKRNDENAIITKLNTIEQTIESVKNRYSSFYSNVSKKINDIDKYHDNQDNTHKIITDKLQQLTETVQNIKTNNEATIGKLSLSLQDMEKFFTKENQEFFLQMKNNYNGMRFFNKHFFSILGGLVLILTFLIYGKEFIKWFEPKEKEATVQESSSKKK